MENLQEFRRWREVGSHQNSLKWKNWVHFNCCSGFGIRQRSSSGKYRRSVRIREWYPLNSIHWIVSSECGASVQMLHMWQPHVAAKTLCLQISNCRWKWVGLARLEQFKAGDNLHSLGINRLLGYSELIWEHLKPIHPNGNSIISLFAFLEPTSASGHRV